MEPECLNYEENLLPQSVQYRQVVGALPEQSQDNTFAQKNIINHRN